MDFGIFELIICVAVILFGLNFVIPLLRTILNYYLGAKLFSKRKSLKKAGDWAVVTGSTDGIGKEYVSELASDGFNIVLISRNADKLADVSNEIASKYKVLTKTITADFTKADIYDLIQQQIEGLKIAVLVNNVGISYPFPNFFWKEFPQGFFKNMINCNVTSVTMMTSIILPGMITRGNGAIINVGSSSGLMPTALLACYSATKVYVDFFSRSLSYETKGHGIIVQHVSPFFVATKMTRLKPSFTTVTPRFLVNNSLNLLGVDDNIFGSLIHSIIGITLKCLPEFVYSYFSFNMLDGFRKKNLRRIQKSE